MFKFWSGSQEQQEIPTESWYPPSVVGSSSTNSSRSSTENSASGPSMHRTSDRSQSLNLQSSPTEAAGIIARLKDKSTDELRKLLNEKDAYNDYLHSLDQVKNQNSLLAELRKETTQLARENLEKEPQILELRNQCRIIRTTELAAALEKLNELERQKDEKLRFYSPSVLLQAMQDAMSKVEDESEVLHRQLLDKQIDFTTFVQKYKKLRTLYHKRSLLQLAAKTSFG